MALSPGTRLGPYEIVSALGAGGMGEVYKARDGRLDRSVAIKILPEALAGDREFRDRFDREARAVSHLDHPHICALYDIGEDQGTSYLVMQYLEGETLEQHLRKGPLPIDQALKTAIEIAGALDSAHRAGIIHRDLKPGNVILTKAGAKLLDFGLAKASATTGGSASMLQTTPPAALTAQGTILGTFQYMAPEQLDGQEADARTDIFAFGAVLYEMLTGRKVFGGKTQASLVGAILRDEPPPVSQVQPMTPPALDYLVRTCLAKDPDGRFQTAHDVRLQLRWVAEGGSAAGVPVPVVSRRRSREQLAWAMASVLAVIALGAGMLAFTHLREQPAPVQTVQFAVGAEDNSTLRLPADFAISPDGRQVAFVASPGLGGALARTSMIWVRPFDSLDARPLPGTEGAFFPFWSPDSRYIAFDAAGKLMKVDVAGGPPIALCDIGGLLFGGAWNQSNVIVVASGAGGARSLFTVDAAGGIPAPFTTRSEGEDSHRWPSFLPDGRHVLYISLRGANRELRVASLGSTETVSLGQVDSNAFYDSGHLLFVLGGTLMARRFDLEKLQMIDAPFPVTEQVSVNAARASLSVSGSGVLGFWRGGGLAIARLSWTDRDGRPSGVIGEPGAYSNLSLSPDERRVAVTLTTGTPPNRDVWVIDLAREDTASRLTFDRSREGDPIWSPDGSQIVFNSDRTGSWNGGFQRPSDGSGEDQQLVTMERLFDSPDWSHDGRFIVFTGAGNGESNDLWVLPLSGDRKPAPFLQSPFNEDSPAFSPDSRWVAYNSDASGRFEVYVRSFPGPGGQFQISRNGGWAPRWRRDGKEIFFLALDGTMMAADVASATALQVGVPRALFPTRLLKGPDRHLYAVTGNGQRFLLRVPDERQVTLPITLVLNWTALAKR